MRNLIRFALPALLPLLAMLPAGASAHPAHVKVGPVFWYRCVTTGGPGDLHKVCHEYLIRHPKGRAAGYTKHCQSYIEEWVCTRYPRWYVAPKPAPASYTETMLVTYYLDVGPMADGVWTYWGAAACGFDLALGTRVSVPGVGILTCHDRIGYQPYAHIDVWGYRPGLGADYRTVTVYR